MIKNDSMIILDDISFSSKDVLNALRKTKQLTVLVGELVLEHILSATIIDPEREDHLMLEFQKKNNLDDEIALIEFLDKQNLDEILLKSMLIRPDKIVKFREERWGPRAHSLYLKHKDSYDLITYRKLESTNHEVMLEIFFRLKDKEESWESLARQFPGSDPNANAKFGPIPVRQIEPMVLEELRKAGPKNIIRPIRIEGKTIVAELEELQSSKFNEDIRTLILREEFDQWLDEECKKMISKMRLTA